MTNKEIGKRIETARLNANLNKKELAQKIKVADSTIKRYEDGSISKIKMPIIESIAYATSVNPMWIIGKSENMELERYLESHDFSQKNISVQSPLQFYEKKLLESFSQLNDINKKKSISYTENLLANQKLDEELETANRQPPLLQAAHARTDIEQTPEGIAHDLALMEDDSNWK